MALPMPSTIRLPSVLGGKSNGRLPDSILVSAPGLASGPTVRLVEVAMRSWKALTAAATAAGHTLKATSAGDSYRPYPLQQTVFTQRYTTTVLAGRPFKTWNGVRWYQKPGTAKAAVPGTSNHGWGITVDTGEESDGDSGVESIDAATLAWLTRHAPAYGWYWELASEPWHIRYVSGDIIPPAVLAYERGGTPTQGDDMVIYQLPNGWVGCSTGTTRYGYATEADLKEAMAAFGITSLRKITEAQLGAYGIDVRTLDDGGDRLTLTDEQVKALGLVIVDAVPSAGEIADAVVDEEHDRLAN